MILKFRPLTPADYPLMFHWLSMPHVREWWDDSDDTVEKVAAHYGRYEEGLERFILVDLTGGREKPIGYFQLYTAPEGAVGIDQFIGDESYLNRGIGTLAVRHFVKMIVRKYKPSAVILDPSPANRRAIRCYEKAGFRYYETKRTGEGLAYMMRLSISPAGPRQ
jgi:aminoglycoside 6'-N-acetyltransferase